MQAPKRKILECKRCGHQWFPYFKRKPKHCPKCHSPYWDKERHMKIKPKKGGK